MWQYQGQDFDVVPDEMIGFVYCIVNTETGKRYIGKKLLVDYLRGYMFLLSGVCVPSVAQEKTCQQGNEAAAANRG